MRLCQDHFDDLVRELGGRSPGDIGTGMSDDIAVVAMDECDDCQEED